MITIKQKNACIKLLRGLITLIILEISLKVDFVAVGFLEGITNFKVKN